MSEGDIAGAGDPARGAPVGAGPDELGALAATAGACGWCPAADQFGAMEPLPVRVIRSVGSRRANAMDADRLDVRGDKSAG